MLFINDADQEIFRLSGTITLFPPLPLLPPEPESKKMSGKK
jgi:hypothetical protein